MKLKQTSCELLEAYVWPILRYIALMCYALYIKDGSPIIAANTVIISAILFFFEVLKVMHNLLKQCKG